MDATLTFEQKIRVQVNGQVLTLRRITVCLDQPTREGDTELHVLTNVPASDASACTLADMYRQRCEIENAFHVLTMTFNCEMASNCHPRAALFQFCMAVVAYNCRQVLLAALYAEHEQEQVEQMSQYQVVLEVVRPLEGMLTADPGGGMGRTGSVNVGRSGTVPASRQPACEREELPQERPRPQETQALQTTMQNRYPRLHRQAPWHTKTKMLKALTLHGPPRQRHEPPHHVSLKG